MIKHVFGNILVLGMLVLLVGMAAFQSSSNANAWGAIHNEESVVLNIGSDHAFLVGDSFALQGAGPYAGQTLTATVLSVFATGPSGVFNASLNLVDAQGNIIDTQTVGPEVFLVFHDVAGNNVVKEDLYLKVTEIDPTTNQGYVSFGIADKHKVVFVGDSLRIAGDFQYSGQRMTITLVSIAATGPTGILTAKFIVADEFGTIVDTQSVQANELVGFTDNLGYPVISGIVFLSGIHI